MKVGREVGGLDYGGRGWGREGYFVLLWATDECYASQVGVVEVVEVKWFSSLVPCSHAALPGSAVQCNNDRSRAAARGAAVPPCVLQPRQER